MATIFQEANIEMNIPQNNTCQESSIKNINSIKNLLSENQQPFSQENSFNQETSPIAILDQKYSLIKKIGQGSSAKVYLGYLNKDPEKKIYSIKVINPKKTDIKLYKTEIELLENISHKNVLEIFDHGVGEKIKKNGKKKQVYYLVMEYLSHDDLLKYITHIIPGENKGFGEEFGRLIFAQLLDGLEAIHNSNISHRDIKLENIMIGNDYVFKYVDFGFGTYNNSGKLCTFLGTPSYAAPELHLKRPYYGISEDIFSLGVTLFVLVTGTLPFKLAIPNDSFYKYFVKSDYVGFWGKRLINVSPSFMELFDNLVAYDYSQRPSISEIRESAWMKEIDWNLLPYLKRELIFREEKIVQRRNEDMIKEIRYKEMKKNIMNNKNNNSENVKKPVVSLLEIKRKRKVINNNENVDNIKNEINLNENINIINKNIELDEENNNKCEEKKFIIIDLNNNNDLNSVIIDIKKVLKKEGYIPTKMNINELKLEVSNGEVDIVLIFEKVISKSFVKIHFWKKKGSEDHFELFERLMKEMHHHEDCHNC